MRVEVQPLLTPLRLFTISRMESARLPNAEAEQLPLDGVRVLDLTTTLAGPSATRQMADFGAEVIKIESRHHLDTARLAGPHSSGGPGLNRSGYFAGYNAGKRSLALNLRSPAGVQILRRLVLISDVLIESFRPGVMRDLGISEDVLRGWNPGLVMASHSLQGQTGPRAAQRGYGQLASAMTGWFDITGDPAGPPVGPFSAYTDFIAAPLLLAAVLVALEHRDATGNGQYIDQSHVASSAYFIGPELVAAQRGAPPTRSGNRESYACPNGVFACRGEDRWCAITVTNQTQWRALCCVLGSSELAEHASFHDHIARKAHEDEVETVVASRTQEWDARALAEALTTVGVPSGIVYRAEDLFTDEQLRHRRAFRRLEHPDHGQHSVLTVPYRMNGVNVGPSRAFPRLGEDTLWVCQDLLGLSEEEIKRCSAAGAFG